MSKTIAIVATLDTKGDHARYVKEFIEKKGHRTITIDSGVLGEPLFPGDLTREKVAQCGGKSLSDLVVSAHKGLSRSSIIEVTIRGIVKIVKELYATEKLDGIISLGGGTGSVIGISAMKALPIGVPKVMVSTYIPAELIGEKDITVMQTPADIIGHNVILQRALANAAGAIAGMVEADVLPPKAGPLVAMTSLGVTTPGVMKILHLLERRGYECIAFHSKSGTLDELIDEGKICGVIDITPSELVRTFIHPTGAKSLNRPRESRLEPAGTRGLPQIIAPGSLDMHILRGTLETVNPLFRCRRSSQHTPSTLLVRTTTEESARLGKIIAERANLATDRLVIVIPMRGFSALDRVGGAFYDPKANRAFVDAVIDHVEKRVKVVKVDAHINDETFAEKVVDIFDELCSLGSNTQVRG